MKINKSRLSPLYDQYSNDENRLTHALLHTIGSSGWIFTRFLKKILVINISLLGTHCEISSQKVPFSHGDNDPEDVESLDAGITEEIDLIINPPEKTIAGDYMLTVRVSSENSNDSIDIRVTVLTPTIWGWVGIGIIVVVVIGVAVIFARLGRR